MLSLHTHRQEEGQSIFVQLREVKCAAFRITWDNPFGGDGSDTFVLSEDGNILTQVCALPAPAFGQLMAGILRLRAFCARHKMTLPAWSYAGI